jgi:hypothetical protein
MNGIHDLGGMHGLGKIVHTAAEPAFNAAWEGRVFAMFLSMSGVGHMNLDEFRHAMEKMDVVQYLSSPYYAHWLHGLQELIFEKGIISAADLEARIAQMKGGSTCQSC